LLGLCALAVAGLVVALVVVASGNGGGSPRALPTTGSYAPISVPTPTVPIIGGAALGDPEGATDSYLSGTLSFLPGRHRYRLIVTNTSNVGYINAFQWYPPTGTRILKVIGNSAGHCVLSGLSGFGGNQFRSVLLFPNILCDGLRLKPPTCTCAGDGGAMSISFVLDKPTAFAGSPRLISATPVLRVTPSYQK
jgi:hypothetical protein